MAAFSELPDGCLSPPHALAICFTGGDQFPNGGRPKAGASRVCWTVRRTHRHADGRRHVHKTRSCILY
jgi:hypothetical protein